MLCNALFGGLDFRAAILSDADRFLARRNGGRRGVIRLQNQVRVQRQAQQVVERNRHIVDLQALHKGGLLGIESGGATLQGNLLQRLAPFHVAQAFLQLDLACGHLFRAACCLSCAMRMP